MKIGRALSVIDKTIPLREKVKISLRAKGDKRRETSDEINTTIRVKSPIRFLPQCTTAAVLGRFSLEKIGE
jgi:hypothetical protein